MWHTSEFLLLPKHLIGKDIHSHNYYQGRRREEMEDLVGFFTINQITCNRPQNFFYCLNVWLERTFNLTTITREGGGRNGGCGRFLFSFIYLFIFYFYLPFKSVIDLRDKIKFMKACCWVAFNYISFGFNVMFCRCQSSIKVVLAIFIIWTVAKKPGQFKFRSRPTWGELFHFTSFTSPPSSCNRWAKLQIIW